jgi:hypothetical protein
MLSLPERALGRRVVESPAERHGWFESGMAMRESLAENVLGCVFLLRTDLSVKCIADKTGFRNPSYFVRRFRCRLGSTPLSWRRSTASPANPSSSTLAGSGTRLRITWPPPPGDSTNCAGPDDPIGWRAALWETGGPARTPLLDDPGTTGPCRSQWKAPCSRPGALQRAGARARWNFRDRFRLRALSLCCASRKRIPGKLWDGCDTGSLLVAPEPAARRGGSSAGISLESQESQSPATLGGM